MRLRLTDKHWLAIDAGEDLIFPPSEEPPLVPGQEIVLEAREGTAFRPDEVEKLPAGAQRSVKAPVLWLTVVKVRRTKTFHWQATYKMCDLRPLWMKSGPPRPEGNRLRQRVWTEAEERGLTRVVSQALDPEVESALPIQFQNALAMRARLKKAEDMDPEEMEHRAKKQARSINESIREMLLARARLGLPPDNEAMADLYRAMEALRPPDDDHAEAA